jgi:hypothetical protein
MSQEIVLALRSKSSSHTTSHIGSTTKTSYNTHNTHHGSGGSAIWFVIIAIVAVVAVFFGVRFLRNRGVSAV